MVNAAAFGIGRGIIYAGEARMGDGPCAHRAWFQRHPKVASLEPLIPQNPRGGADCLHFGVRGWILGGAHAIGCCSNFNAIFGDNGTHRHFARIGGGLRQFQCAVHKGGEGNRHGPL